MPEEQTYKVTARDLRDFMLAVDNYATASAHREKHMKGRFEGVVWHYATMTGKTLKQSHKELFEVLP